MQQDTFALLIGGFLLTHFSAVIGATVWAIRHIVSYNLLLQNFQKLQNDFQKLQNDVTQAHNKIRELKK